MGSASMHAGEASFNYDADKLSIQKTEATIEKIIGGDGYDDLVNDARKAFAAIRDGVRTHHTISEEDAEYMIQIVLHGLKTAIKRTDWRLGYGRVRTDATVPEVAAHLSYQAVSLLEEAFSPRGIRAYRNRHHDFIEAMAEFAEEANGGIAGHMDFYSRLGRQVAQAVLDHQIVSAAPALVPSSARYDDIEKVALEQVVYFIRAGDEGPIKIGIARDPASRLSTLQTGHHDTLVLVAMTSGGAAREADYHRQFASHRVRGEWFAPHPDILAEIDRLNSLGPKRGCNLIPALTNAKGSSHG